MYKLNSTFAIPASDSAIEDIVAAADFRTLMPATIVASEQSSTSKRIRSRGEKGKSKSTVSSADYNRDKYRCANCGRMLSRKTKHPTSACALFARRNNRTPVTDAVPYLPILSEELNIGEADIDCIDSDNDCSDSSNDCTDSDSDGSLKDNTNIGAAEAITVEDGIAPSNCDGLWAQPSSLSSIFNAVSSYFH